MKMSKINVAVVVILGVLAVEVISAPQGNAPEEAPQPYEYNYKVEDKANNVYFGANEAGQDSGRVEGAYYVWLPDGRLMTVSYYVDKESGYVPKITFQENANPLTGP